MNEQDFASQNEEKVSVNYAQESSATSSQSASFDANTATPIDGNSTAPMTVHVKTMTGEKHALENLPPTTTIKTFEEEVRGAFDIATSEPINLVYQGKNLIQKPDLTIGEARLSSAERDCVWLIFNLEAAAGKPQKKDKKNNKQTEKTAALSQNTVNAESQNVGTSWFKSVSDWFWGTSKSETPPATASTSEEDATSQEAGEDEAVQNETAQAATSTSAEESESSEKTEVTPSTKEATEHLKIATWLEQYNKTNEANPIRINKDYKANIIAALASCNFEKVSPEHEKFLKFISGKKSYAKKFASLTKEQQKKFLTAYKSDKEQWILDRFGMDSFDIDWQNVNFGDMSTFLQKIAETPNTNDSAEAELDVDQQIFFDVYGKTADWVEKYFNQVSSEEQQDLSKDSANQQLGLVLNNIENAATTITLTNVNKKNGTDIWLRTGYLTATLPATPTTLATTKVSIHTHWSVEDNIIVSSHAKESNGAQNSNNSSELQGLLLTSRNRALRRAIRDAHERFTPGSKKPLNKKYIKTASIAPNTTQNPKEAWRHATKKFTFN